MIIFPKGQPPPPSHEFLPPKNIHVLPHEPKENHTSICNFQLLPLVVYFLTTSWCCEHELTVCINPVIIVHGVLTHPVYVYIYIYVHLKLTSCHDHSLYGHKNMSQMADLVPRLNLLTHLKMVIQNKRSFCSLDGSCLSFVSPYSRSKTEASAH